MAALRVSSYAGAGVDLAKVKSMQQGLAEVFGATFRYRSRGLGRPMIPLGHYAGLVDIGHGMALALHTDGVGTKVLVAQELGRFDTVGIDCVAMTVNDLICLGAEPVAVLDYIAVQREDRDLVAEISKGLAEGARRACVAIVGGETAVMGDVVKGVGGKGFDLVSMGAALVRRSEVIDGSKVAAGDAVVAVRSSGLHSNGYTLARKVLRGCPLGRRIKGLRGTLGTALLEPTRIYVKPALRAIRGYDIHGVAHVTGGSFTKLTRLLGGRRLMFDLNLKDPDPIFKLIQSEGGISDAEMRSTFNMGVGLCLCVGKGEASGVIGEFERAGFDAYIAGGVRKGSGVVVDGLRLV